MEQRPDRLPLEVILLICERLDPESLLTTYQAIPILRPHLLSRITERVQKTIDDGWRILIYALPSGEERNSSENDVRGLCHYESLDPVTLDITFVLHTVDQEEEERHIGDQPTAPSIQIEKTSTITFDLFWIKVDVNNELDAEGWPWRFHRRDVSAQTLGQADQDATPLGRKYDASKGISCNVARIGSSSWSEVKGIRDALRTP